MKGFTLIELVVSIGILAILAGLALAILNPFEQFKKAQDARRKSDLAQVQKALEQYYQDTGHYPSSSGAYQIVGQGGTIIWGQSWAPYLDVVPTDPESKKTYAYYAPTSPAGLQTYYLYASLDRAKDIQACNSGAACISITSNSISTAACGSGYTCNYGVTSPNVSP